MTVPQHLQALQSANEIRMGGVTVKREIRAGTLTVAQALHDPRAQNLPVSRVLIARPGWGPARVHAILRRVPVSPIRPVRDLTAREHRHLTQLVQTRTQETPA